MDVFAKNPKPSNSEEEKGSFDKGFQVVVGGKDVTDRYDDTDVEDDLLLDVLFSETKEGQEEAFEKYEEHLTDNMDGKFTICE